MAPRLARCCGNCAFCACETRNLSPPALPGACGEGLLPLSARVAHQADLARHGVGAGSPFLQLAIDTIHRNLRAKEDTASAA